METLKTLATLIFKFFILPVFVFLEICDYVGLLISVLNGSAGFLDLLLFWIVIVCLVLLLAVWCVAHLRK